MTDPTNFHSLADFQRNARSFIEGLNDDSSSRTGLAAVTCLDKAELFPRLAEWS